MPKKALALPDGLPLSGPQLLNIGTQGEHFRDKGGVFWALKSVAQILRMTGRIGAA